MSRNSAEIVLCSQLCGPCNIFSSCRPCDCFQAAQSVTQRVQIVDGEAAKFEWLSKNLLGLLSLSRHPDKHQQQLTARVPEATVEEAAAVGGVVFCSSQQRVEDLAFLLDTAIAQQVSSSAVGVKNPEGGDAASRAAAARLLRGEVSQDLRKNANQTFKCTCSQFVRGNDKYAFSCPVRTFVCQALAD